MRDVRGRDIKPGDKVVFSTCGPLFIGIVTSVGPKSVKVKTEANKNFELGHPALASHLDLFNVLVVESDGKTTMVDPV